MDVLPGLEAPQVEEEEDTGSYTIGTVTFPPNLSNLAGVETVVRNLNRIIWEHNCFRFQLFYGLYYG